MRAWRGLLIACRPAISRSSLTSGTGTIRNRATEENIEHMLPTSARNLMAELPPPSSFEKKLTKLITVVNGVVAEAFESQVGLW